MKSSIHRVTLKTVLIVLASLVITSALVVAVGAATADTSPDSNENDRLVVVVTASRLPQPLSEIPVTAHVVEREEIVDAGARSLADALRLVPGLSVISYGSRGSAQQASLRGSTSQQVLVLVDGLPAASPQGAFSLAHIPVATVQRIEVLKGPGSALYGANAVGGVINVITSPLGVPPESQVSVRGGRGDIDWMASNTGLFGRTNYTVSAGYADSGGHRPNADHQERHVRLSLDRELSAISEASLQVTWFDSESGVPGSTLFPSADARQRDVQARSKLSYIQDLSDGELQSVLYARQYQREYADNFGKSRHDTFTFGGEAQRDLELEMGSLTLGLTVQNDRVVSTSLVGGEQAATSGALFAQFVRDYNTRVSVTTGVRIDAHSAYPAPISPRLGVRARLSTESVLRVSAGRSFRAPTFDDLYWAGAGNSNLLPEVGWNYEVGLRHDLGWAESDVAVFQRQTDNLIRWAPGSGGVWRPYNIAESRTRGLEAEVLVPLALGFELTTQWTILDARDARSGDRLAFIPSHEGRAGLGYNQGGVRAHLSVHHRGARPTASGSELDAYTVVNGRISRSLGSLWEVSLEGKNLLDGEYSEAEGYPLPGRSIWIGASHRF